MSISTRNIDARWIYLAVMISIILPILFPIGLPISISEGARDVYNAVEAVPEGGYVIFFPSFNYGGKGEMFSMAQAFIKHCLSQNLKLVIISFAEPMMSLIGEEAFLSVGIENYGAVYGEDIVHLGLLAGGEVTEAGFAADVHALVQVDYYGTPISELPIMDNLRSANDIDLVIILTNGGDSPAQELRQFKTGFGVAVTGGAVGGVYGSIVPYIDSGQLSGYLPSLRGTAEYELLLGKPGTAILGMDAQSLMHIVVLIFIILGNLGVGTTISKTGQQYHREVTE